LSFWDGDDGMVCLRGELDPVTGAKVRKRFAQEAARLRRADLHSAGGDKRNLNQRMADALDALTSHGSTYSRADADSEDCAGEPAAARARPVSIRVRLAASARRPTSAGVGAGRRLTSPSSSISAPRAPTRSQRSPAMRSFRLCMLALVSCLC